MLAGAGECPQSGVQDQVEASNGCGEDSASAEESIKVEGSEEAEESKSASPGESRGGEADADPARASGAFEQPAEGDHRLQPKRRRRSKGPGGMLGSRLPGPQIPGQVGPQGHEGAPVGDMVPDMRDKAGCAVQEARGFEHWMINKAVRSGCFVAAQVPNFENQHDVFWRLECQFQSLV